MPPPGSRTARLARAVLDAEASREERQAAARDPAELPEDQLPGVGSEAISLREGLQRGGMITFVVLMVLAALEELESGGLIVLAPDIRNSLHVSDGTIAFIVAAAGAFIVLGAVPMGWMADRFRRGPVIGWASATFALAVATCGFAVNAFMLFWTRLGVGVSKASTISVHSSLLADAYPIEVRGRVFGGIQTAVRAVGVISPILMGGIATLAGGSDGWRWAFVVASIPVAFFAFTAFRLPEPPRGQFEMADVLGDVLDDDQPAPISVEAGFARLLQIRTLKTVIVAFSAMGFGLFALPVLGSLFLQRHYGLDAFERGLVTATSLSAVVVVTPFAARYYDGLYRRDPARALRLLGLFVLPSALLMPAQWFMPNAALYAILGIPQTTLLFVGFAMIGPLIQAVTPYRLRGLGAALGSVYVFFIGATGGALLAALFTDTIGIRATALLLVVPSTVVGGLLVIRSASFIRNDLSLIVRELHEEQEETERRRREPDRIPALQVSDIDYSYGPVQVLFDVGFEVHPGQVLALLGTNGAGKSTVLRAIAGLGTPSRGVVRLHGRNVTYTTPEQRARLGVRTLLGGKGVFPAMTVRENLEIAAFVYRADRTDFDRRIAGALELFPTLTERDGQRASSLSGGQQQMLALAMTLLHDPDVLAIDELSLGLAPILVEQLLAVIERLKQDGKTIILVEQSLNIALSVADRAIFLEKGQVRFDGSADELALRHDLARAVFLGHEGG
jgi:ABC-type branched-subunit amino acid transport system ATPase component/predicted MFS family arabinose efflux permease